ncbi:zinc metalloproteinase nas-15 [Exaiptasia diaphana]|uniref:Metalloendopeptidase n=1 Tax=Exaiptasia diaphana TaxID=2652724 RepID=A0A913X823_EXADI|nr:zinc metalloproteinase nas-15 [Exaiptasia diaphana]
MEAYMPEENVVKRNVFEGDIYLDKSTENILEQLMSPTREALVNPISHWKDGRVPYQFGPVSDEVKRVFKEAIAEYKKHTCIEFVPRTSERDYIYVVAETGCWSSVGRSGYRQKLSIGTNCERKGTVMHEMMHALGFFHEQSRLDRDDYISIHWENIDPKKRFNFQKYEHGQADTLGARYDYGSIMHYPMYAFTNNGRATIVPKDPNAEIGQRTHLSNIDIQQVNKLYKCQATTTPAPTPAPTTKPCTDKLDVCYYYAYFGYCSYYREFMSTNCRKSCFVC